MTIADLTYFNKTEFLNKETKFLKKHNLVKLKSSKDLIIEVPYSTANNFCHCQIYSHPFIYLHRDAYDNLQKVISEASKLALKIKIWDGFRPFEAQSFMADKYPQMVEAGYVSHPKNGIATHVRGIAVDLTLVDQQNNELDMGTYFDEMNEKAHHNASDLNEVQKKNRQILIELMTQKADFELYDNEWWHYNLKIFQRNKNNEIHQALPLQDKIYPKITEPFTDLLSSEVQEFYNHYGQNYHFNHRSIFKRIFNKITKNLKK